MSSKRRPVGTGLKAQQVVINRCHAFLKAFKWCTQLHARPETPSFSQLFPPLRSNGIIPFKGWR
jgi:hypothetical protein